MAWNGLKHTNFSLFCYLFELQIPNWQTHIQSQGYLIQANALVFISPVNIRLFLCFPDIYKENKKRAVAWNK